MFEPRDTADIVDLTPRHEPAAAKKVRVMGPARPRRKVAREMTDTTHSDLMVRVRDHQDREAFAALFEHFAPRLKAFLMKSGSPADQAEEFAQDVMVTLWQKSEQFDPSRASAATWIFTIARNRRIDAYRRGSRPDPEDLPWGPEPEPDQADVIALQQETDRLSAALAELPEKQRNIVRLAYFGDLTQSELAAQTGLPLGTIKSRMRLALTRLRHAMGQD